MAVTNILRVVSLSANIEWFESESGTKQPAQEVMRKLFWSYRPELEVSCVKHFKEGQNYHFHVCFVTTKAIPSEEHARKIKQAFIEIVKKHISQIRFHLGEVRSYVIQDQGKYLDGRSPNNSPIVMVAKNAGDFKKVNQELLGKLTELNKIWDTDYELADDVHPRNYIPHITLVNRPALRELKIAKEKILEELNRSSPQGTLTLKDHKYKIV